MKANEYKAQWLHEQEIAHMQGWDFSHLAGRYTEEDDLPWDYQALVRQHLHANTRLLDIDTGGGEFLLSLGHPCALISATEAWPPNAALCAERLLPRGVDFRVCKGDAPMPFEKESFDLIVNRHGSFHPGEIARMLKPGGVFITQQVGEDNDRELVELLLPGTPKPFPGMNLREQSRRLRDAGLVIRQGEEAYRPIRFYDTGALVWFARIISWEFPGFSVERCLPQLEVAQRILEEKGSIEGSIHRYLIVAEKQGSMNSKEE